MILTVEHLTTYAYDQPVRALIQSHRLTPSTCDSQKVRRWAIEVTGTGPGGPVPGIAGGGFRDGAGDWVQGVAVRGPVSEVVVRVTGEVETFDLAGVLRGTPRETVSPEAYLRPTAVTRPDAGLTELGRDAVAGAVDPLDAAHRLSAAVAEAIAFAPGATDAQTTAAEALAKGEGVCQDHAHALIAAARSQGIPARYISGYLKPRDDKPGPRRAAHAWAELAIAGLGWVGFDPTNRCCPDDRFIRLGSGYDARDAAPIRGIARGQVAESLDVSLTVQSQQ